MGRGAGKAPGEGGVDGRPMSVSGDAAPACPSPGPGGQFVLSELEEQMLE